LEIFSSVRALAPDNFDLVLQIGVLQRQLEMYPESETTFRDASLIAPARYEPHLNLSVVYDLTGQLDKAIESARTALDLDPERSSVRTYLAQLLMKNSLFTEAAKVLQEGLVNTPDDTDLLYQLAITHDRSGRFDLAEDILKRIIEIDPEHFDAMNYLGYSWADRDMNLDESLVLVKKALRIKPDAAYIIDSLGWVYFRMGHYEEALEYLLKAGEKMEGDPTVLEHIGDTYEKLGKTDLAIRFWSLALKADPGNAGITEKLKGKGVVETAP
jgi:tetratricopeptide (TPR) repeat protein